ncbi:helix-turn-helix domain-containing protein [Scytonema sp. PCC 10023]|uniref:helix-turn-helix domain-containing protein n=1 Tax=Scytonema sp. PCC 10023 TaxID=1680591 RepID=UPI0039C6B9E5
MYSLKLELKLNNKEKTKLHGCAGFARFVYNFGLSLPSSERRLPPYCTQLAVVADDGENRDAP